MNRRMNTRVEWNDSIRYRKLPKDTFKIGMLVNISTSGALLWLTEDIDVGSDLEVVVQSDHKPLHMQMRVLRTEETQHIGYTGYGCGLEMTVCGAR